MHAEELDEQFLQAAQKGDVAYITKHIHDVNADVRATAFVLSPSLPVCTILLGSGVDINTCIQDKRYSNDEYWWTALGLACRTSNILKIKWLISQGVDVNGLSVWIHEFVYQEEYDNKFETYYTRREKERISLVPLLDASSKGLTEIVNLLIKAGADVNKQTSTKNGTALMQAAKLGYIDIVKLLLSSGADVNAKDKNGQTALMLAAYTGNLDIVKVLVVFGANVNAIDCTSRTALDYIKSAQIANKTLKCDVINLLCGKETQTAEELEQQDLAESAESPGARSIPKRPASNFRGSPPDMLHQSDNGWLQYRFVYFCRWGSISDVEASLSLGADVNGSSLERTPLGNAVLGGKVDIAELLLKHGATITSYVLALAEKCHNKEIINLLKSYRTAE